MRIQVHYKNVEGSEAINNFIKGELEMMCSKFKVNGGSADIYIESVRARTDNRHPVFACEIIYKTDFNRYPQKIFREGRDLFTLIGEALWVAEQNFSEMSSRKNDHRRYHRREYKREASRVN